MSEPGQVWYFWEDEEEEKEEEENMKERKNGMELTMKIELSTYVRFSYIITSLPPAIDASCYMRILIFWYEYIHTLYVYTPSHELSSQIGRIHASCVYNKLRYS